MMLGTIAQHRGGADGGGTLAFADFVNGVYSVAGSAVTAADVVDQPGLIGASGLEINDESETAVVEIIGGFRDVLLTLNWTVVIEYEALDALHRAFLLAMRDTADTQTFHIERRTTGNGLAMLAQDIAVDFRENLDTTGYGIGIHKVAVTHTTSRLATSVDGNPVVEDLDSMSLTLNNAAFGNYAGESFAFSSCFIRSIAVYAAVASADLPALSA